MTNTVYVINRCDYLPEAFFEQFIPGCVVEDGCVVKFEGKEYDMVLMDVVGIDVQRDLQFYTLVEYKVN
jgi:hypothetical protein